ncbi:hypothetical protein [Vibrio cholerae]|uniref:hypothetical protein n=1 Tax=Vibrio cholerae TaxID=666 RepID=UPI0011D64B55|nr:hypothetical protein [Vibrio cholerae]TXY52063.1 hypothetical protein FXE74_18960 [Vibrio cholerae]GIB31823.1 hypothetical protein VCSRO91_2836 [Vibrio cholerae]
MQIIYPKNASVTLKKKTEKALMMVQKGASFFRTSNRNGYQTLVVGHCERLVKVGDLIRVFSKHSDYEKFINRTH